MAKGHSNGHFTIRNHQQVYLESLTGDLLGLHYWEFDSFIPLPPTSQPSLSRKGSLDSFSFSSCYPKTASNSNLYSLYMASVGVALVTGASKGIGRAIALRLAKDGFKVGVNDVPAARNGLESLREEIRERGGKATIAVGDVSREADVKDMISNVVKDLGRLDVVSCSNCTVGVEHPQLSGYPSIQMVANAGICRAHLITDTDVGEWDKLFAVNARGTFLCYKYAALQMIKQGQGGRIIGASSLAGRRGEGHLASYSASKFAVRGLTQAAATEWGRHGITVNAYCPGVIQTDIIKDIAEGTSMPLDEVYSKHGGQTALGYHGTVEDVASAVAFLASKDARYIT
ncbi:hypothetical protein H0H93_006426, partial [Arthromyces matolae]